MVSTLEPIVVSRSLSKDLICVFFFAADLREIHSLGDPVIIRGFYEAKVIIARTMSAIQPEPSASLPSTRYSDS